MDGSLQVRCFYMPHVSICHVDLQVVPLFWQATMPSKIALPITRPRNSRSVSTFSWGNSFMAEICRDEWPAAHVLFLNESWNWNCCTGCTVCCMTPVYTGNILSYKHLEIPMEDLLRSHDPVWSERNGVDAARKRQASWYFQASGFGNSSRSSVTRKRPYSGLNAVSANLKWQRLLESIYLITSG